MSKQRAPRQDTVPPWVTIADAAYYLGVDARTVRRYIAEGRLTASRIGPRLLRVQRDSLLALARPLGGGR
jgi:excisionase family DNA binding protein